MKHTRELVLSILSWQMRWGKAPDLADMMQVPGPEWKKWVELANEATKELNDPEIYAAGWKAAEDAVKRALGKQAARYELLRPCGMKHEPGMICCKPAGHTGDHEDYASMMSWSD